MNHPQNKGPHTTQVSWSEVRQRVFDLNEPLARALDQVAQSTGKNVLPIYLARYSYGQPIVSARKELGRRFHPPCNSADCTECKALIVSCEDQIPVGIVLQNIAETYSEDAAVTAGQRSSIPIRMVHPGETFGVISMLQTMNLLRIQPTGFNWSLAAGARTIMCSFPVGDTQLIRNILQRGVEGTADKEIINKAKAEFEADNRALIFALLQAARREKKITQFKLNWNLEVLLLPAPIIEKLCSEKTAANENMLLTVLKNTGLKNLASFKNYSEIDAQIAWIIDRITTVPKSIYLQRTVTHVLSILNGIKPGFRPAKKDDSAGPFMGILRYISATGLAKSPGLKGRFPLILQPEQFFDDNRPPLYYSVQEPTVPGPVERKNGTRAESLWNLQRCMLQIKNDAPELLPWELTWTFLSAHPSGKEMVHAGSEVMHIRQHPGLLKDFADQWDLARELWQMDSIDSFFLNVKQEFMAAFVRFQFAQAPQDQMAEQLAS
jgi:hypothetical protein